LSGRTKPDKGLLKALSCPVCLGKKSLQKESLFMEKMVDESKTERVFSWKDNKSIKMRLAQVHLPRESI